MVNREKQIIAIKFFGLYHLSSSFISFKYTIKGTKKQILVEDIPPKIPRTVLIFGNAKANPQVIVHKHAQIVTLAFGVNSGSP